MKSFFLDPIFVFLFWLKCKLHNCTDAPFWSVFPKKKTDFKLNKLKLKRKMCSILCCFAIERCVKQQLISKSSNGRHTTFSLFTCFVFLDVDSQIYKSSSVTAPCAKRNEWWMDSKITYSTSRSPTPSLSNLFLLFIRTHTPRCTLSSLRVTPPPPHRFLFQLYRTLSSGFSYSFLSNQHL